MALRPNAAWPCIFCCCWNHIYAGRHKRLNGCLSSSTSLKWHRLTIGGVCAFRNYRSKFAASSSVCSLPKAFVCSFGKHLPIGEAIAMSTSVQRSILIDIFWSIAYYTSSYYTVRSELIGLWCCLRNLWMPSSSSRCATCRRLSRVHSIRIDTHATCMDIRVVHE